MPTPAQHPGDVHPTMPAVRGAAGDEPGLAERELVVVEQRRAACAACPRCDSLAATHTLCDAADRPVPLLHGRCRLRHWPPAPPASCEHLGRLIPGMLTHHTARQALDRASSRSSKRSPRTSVGPNSRGGGS